MSVLQQENLLELANGGEYGHECNCAGWNRKGGSCKKFSL